MTMPRLRRVAMRVMLCRKVRVAEFAHIDARRCAPRAVRHARYCRAYATRLPSCRLMLMFTCSVVLRQLAIVDYSRFRC